MNKTNLAVAVTHNPRKIHHITIRLEKTLGNNEPPSQRLASLLLGNLGEYPLQILEIIVLIPADDTAGNLDAPANSIADTLIGNDNVSTLRERRDNTRDGRKGLRVHDASRGAKERCHVFLGLHMDILSTVESSRAAGANAVSPEGLDSRLLEKLIGVEVVKIERAEIRDGTPISELRLGPDRTAKSREFVSKRCPRVSSSRKKGKVLPHDYRPLIDLHFLKGSRLAHKWLGRPLVHEVINLIF